MKYLLIALLAISTVSLADEDQSELTFDCIHLGINNCVLRFEADNLREYKLFRISKNGEKEKKGKGILPGDGIKGGHFYYMVGCRGELDCQTSGLYWAPDIRLEYPDHVDFGDGEPVAIQKSTYDEATREWNMYLFLAVAERLDPALFELEMIPPEAHIDGDPLFPHTENVIHHTVYQIYTDKRTRNLASGNNE